MFSGTTQDPILNEVKKAMCLNELSLDQKFIATYTKKLAEQAYIRKGTCACGLSNPVAKAAWKIAQENMVM